MTQYATKGKTYDERIAEQKKQLAMEHSMKAKSKHQQTKKTSKKVDKEHSHSEKKNKVVSSQNTHNKEAKKIDTSKNNVMPNTDKVVSCNLQLKIMLKYFIRLAVLVYADHILSSVTA